MDGEPVTRDVTIGVASLHPVRRRPAGAGFSRRNDRVVPTFGGPLPVGRVGVIGRKGILVRDHLCRIVAGGHPALKGQGHGLGAV